MISSWARCWDKALPCKEKLCKEHGHFDATTNLSSDGKFIKNGNGHFIKDGHANGRFIQDISKNCSPRLGSRS